MHLGSGDFPALDPTIAVSRVTDAYVFLPKQRVSPKLDDRPGTITFGVSIPDTDVIMAALELRPEVSGSETRTGGTVPGRR